MKITDPDIAKEKFNYIGNIKQKIDRGAWIECIESRQDYFTWLEDTEDGKYTLANMHEVPESFREGVLKGLHKSRAFAEFNEKKGFYEIYLDFHEEYGHISTTFQKKIKKHHLQILLDMAKHLDALLLNNGTKIIDQDFVDQY